MKKLFDEVPRLEGARVILDRIVEDDAEGLRLLSGNSNISRYLPTFLFEMQQTDPYETIRLVYGEPFAEKQSLILAIRMKDDGAFCGLAEFYGLRDDAHKISIGYRLLEQCWGQGIASETVALMVEYLFNETDITTITASVMIENTGSARVLEKNVFMCTERGVREDWGFDNPAIVDKYVLRTSIEEDGK
ncbi:MAG: GNAT family N-acetyltransferase [Eggerthellaceae bacterium]|nr:GNAT family N-acetyltransferase [Eggerthellaceae bacterium]